MSDVNLTDGGRTDETFLRRTGDILRRTGDIFTPVLPLCYPYLSLLYHYFTPRLVKASDGRRTDVGRIFIRRTYFHPSVHEHLFTYKRNIFSVACLLRVTTNPTRNL
jgi:hypothetical protein